MNTPGPGKILPNGEVRAVLRKTDATGTESIGTDGLEKSPSVDPFSFFFFWRRKV
jgi:hypothetical protein